MTSNARRLFCAAAFASALVAAPAAEASLLQRIQLLRTYSLPLITNQVNAIGPGKRTLLAFRAYSYNRYISIVLRRPVSAFCRLFC